MNAINANPAQLLDPVQVLLKENLLQIFSYLSQDDIDASSKVNHNWRNSIQSDFSLFICIEVKNEDQVSSPLESLSPQFVKMKGMSKTIGKLSRLSDLSNNRLKSVTIGLSAFEDNLPSFSTVWELSRLSVVFDILSLSSHTLTRIQLDFPKPKPTRKPIALLKHYIQTMLTKLSNFPHLREVGLKAWPLCEVISKSTTKRLRLFSYADDSFYYHDVGNPIFPYEMFSLLSLNTIVASMNAFTGGRLSHLGSTFDEGWEYSAPSLSPEIMNRVQSSTDSLVKLEVEKNGSLLELLNLVVRCPHLISLKIKGYFLEDEVEDEIEDVWEVTLPVDAVEQSRLKTLSIVAEVESGATVLINESMIKWIGVELEELSLKIDSFDVQLHRLIQNVSSTLKSLELDGFYSSSP